MNILNLNNKINNYGATPEGRLDAEEFNQLVETINAHSEAIGDFRLKPIKEEEYDKLEVKSENTIYLILEEDD